MITLKVQCVAFKGICWHEVELKIHMYVFSHEKMLSFVDNKF